MESAHAAITIARIGGLPQWIPNNKALSSTSSTNPTWRVRPSVQLFLGRKPLICRGEGPPKWSKLAVVKTYPVPKRAAMCIIGSRYVPALHDAKEERQRAPLLQPG